MDPKVDRQASVAAEGNGRGAVTALPRPASGVRTPRGNGPAPGERLAGAFASAEAFPVSVDARDRLVNAAAADDENEIIAAVQTDLGLAMAVIRAACRKTATTGGVATVARAVQVLKPTGVLAAAANVPSYDPLSFTTVAEQLNQRLRSHSMATQMAIRAICAELGNEDPAEAVVAAMMHDVGRLILVKMHPDYRPARDLYRRTPEQRIKAERERYGIDHALAGGVLTRRWDLPDRLAVAVERHHNESADGLAALVALADQVVHLRAGDAVSLEQVKLLGQRVGLNEKNLRHVIAGLSIPVSSDTDASAEPSPLSEREHDALVKLSEGKVYKQIAEELGLSVSTVRTHLHNIYRKLEVVDRAQAVIKAREQGWV